MVRDVEKRHAPRQCGRTIDYGGNACFKNEPLLAPILLGGIDVVFPGNEIEAIEGGFVGNVYVLNSRGEK